MGVVYAALDRERGRRVALKTLRKLEPGSLYRLKHEFRAAAGVIHHNLVALYELVSDADQWFITMEYVEGVRFGQYVRSDMSEPPDDTEHGVGLYDQDSVTEHDPRPLARAAPPELDEARLRDALAQLVTGVHALHTAGKLHLHDIERLCIMAVVRDGEVLIRKIRQPFGDGNTVALALEVIEADRLIDNYAQATAPTREQRQAHGHGQQEQGHGLQAAPRAQQYDGITVLEHEFVGRTRQPRPAATYLGNLDVATAEGRRYFAPCATHRVGAITQMHGVQQAGVVLVLVAVAGAAVEALKQAVAFLTHRADAAQHFRQRCAEQQK